MKLNMKNTERSLVVSSGRECNGDRELVGRECNGDRALVVRDCNGDSEGGSGRNAMATGWVGQECPTYRERRDIATDEVGAALIG